MNASYIRLIEYVWWYNPVVPFYVAQLVFYALQQYTTIHVTQYVHCRMTPTGLPDIVEDLDLYYCDSTK